MAKNGQLEVATNGSYATDITVFGSGRTITVTNNEVRSMIANQTKKGKLPSDREIQIFLKLCESRGLDPFAKDVFLLGYDTGDGGAKFEAIVSLQAMLKRAEAHEDYRGKEYGVLVWDAEAKTTIEIKGDTVPNTLPVVGGWCRVFRENRNPEYATATLGSYDKKFGHWTVDKHWMIAKCAIAKALRQAFPGELGDMFTREDAILNQRAATVVQSTESKVNQRVLPKPPAQEPTVDAGDAWEPDEEERAAIEGQLFDSHGDASEL